MSLTISCSARCAHFINTCSPWSWIFLSLFQRSAINFYLSRKSCKPKQLLPINDMKRNYKKSEEFKSSERFKSFIGQKSSFSTASNRIKCLINNLNGNGQCDILVKYWSDYSIFSNTFWFFVSHIKIIQIDLIKSFVRNVVQIILLIFHLNSLIWICKCFAIFVVIAIDWSWIWSLASPRLNLSRCKEPVDKATDEIDASAVSSNWLSKGHESLLILPDVENNLPLFRGLKC